MDWDSALHPRDVTENGIAAFDNVCDWRETTLVCNFDMMDVILPSDA